MNSATLTIAEAADLLGIGRNTAYAAAKTGEIAGIPVIRVGPKRLVIPRTPLEALLGITNPTATGPVASTDHDSIKF
jgi:excisionase family DNA binding protein